MVLESALRPFLVGEEQEMGPRLRPSPPRAWWRGRVPISTRQGESRTKGAFLRTQINGCIHALLQGTGSLLIKQGRPWNLRQMSFLLEQGCSPWHSALITSGTQALYGGSAH